MDQLEKAIEYLNSRGTEVKRGRSATLLQMGTVISLSELNPVLSMVRDGNFDEFLKKIKEMLPQDEIDAFSPDFWIPEKRTIPRVPPEDREGYESKHLSFLRHFMHFFLPIAGMLLIAAILCKIFNCN